MGIDFYVSPAPGHKWGLSLESVAASLRSRWPEAAVVDESPMLGRASLHFNFHDDGHIVIGTYFTDPSETFVIDGIGAAAVPEIVSWFLGLTPPGVPSVTFTDVEPEPRPLPLRADEATLRDLYRPWLD
jgi:hypothetical protein